MNNPPRLSPVMWFAVLALVGSCTPEGRNPLSQAFPTSPSLLPYTTPTALPATTPTPSLGVSFSEEPPAWVSDPGTNVLALAIGDVPLCLEPSTVQLRFINAETGEDFNLAITPARAMFWLDSIRFGLLSPDAETILALNFSNGSVGTTTSQAEGIRYMRWTQGHYSYSADELPCMMNPLSVVATALPAKESAQVIVRQDFSSDLSLLAETDGVLQVWRVESHEPVWTSDTDLQADDLNEYEFAWSPTDPARMAVVECDYKGTDRCFSQRLFIVDVTRGEEMASFPGEFMNISWSPGGSRILYQPPEWQVADFFSGPPCVLDVGTGTNECFPDIPLTHFPKGQAIVGRVISDVQWDRGGDGFYYTFNGSYYPSPSSDPVMLSGLCHYGLIDRKIDCPSEGLPELEGVYITGAEVSPNERAVYLESDMRTPAHGIVDLETHRFIGLPDPPPRGDYYSSFDFVSTLWRPPSTAAAVRTSLPREEDVQEVPSVWDFYELSEGLDLAEPGTRQFSVDVDPGQPFIWPFYWCAADEDTLAENLRSITVDFTVDGIEVSNSDILEYERSTEAWNCHFWATMLNRWESGTESSLIIRYSFRRVVDDGFKEYPAGDYSFEVEARVGN